MVIRVIVACVSKLNKMEMKINVICMGLYEIETRLIHGQQVRSSFVLEVRKMKDKFVILGMTSNLSISSNFEDYLIFILVIFPFSKWYVFA